MNKITVILDAKDELRFTYTLCGQQLTVNKQINALSAFVTRNNNPETIYSTQRFTNPDESNVIFKGESWLAGKTREVICSRNSDGFTIRISHAAGFHVNNDGTIIRQLTATTSVPSTLSDAQLEEILLGPPLMLTLALINRFAFHSSSVMINYKTILFVGESGFGKSTIARWLSETMIDGESIDRLSDDISVITNDNASYQLVSGFPQMKLEQSQQHPNLTPTHVCAIVLLNRAGELVPRLTQVQTLESIAILANHSVATQLFDKSLAENHLAFLCDLSSNIPIYRLDYANGRENIENIAKILKQELN